MIFIYLRIAVLATTALTKGSIECNFSESGMHHCFGAVGQQLFFHLSNKANSSIELKKDDKQRILKTDYQGKMRFDNDFVNPSADISNGTLKLGKAMKKHSGKYLLEEFGRDGKLRRNVNVYLKIQAAVSKPKVFQTCLSPEQMKVSCISEGDDVEFILTLDGQFKMQSKDHSQSLSNWTAEKSTVSNVSINLHGDLIGNFVCQVWNNVSREETVLHLEACKGFVTASPVAVITRVVSFIVIVGLSLILKKLHNKTRSTNIKEGSSEEETIYTDVRVIRNTR